jgi:hypothetical protein
LHRALAVPTFSRRSFVTVHRVEPHDQVRNNGLHRKSFVLRVGHRPLPRRRQRAQRRIQIARLYAGTQVALARSYFARTGLRRPQPEHFPSGLGVRSLTRWWRRGGTIRYRWSCFASAGCPPRMVCRHHQRPTPADLICGLRSGFHACVRILLGCPALQALTVHTIPAEHRCSGLANRCRRDRSCRPGSGRVPARSTIVARREVHVPNH